jgi:type IV secretory pathway VirB3-like protein
MQKSAQPAALAIAGIEFSTPITNIMAMSTIIMILTFICTYALVVLVLFVVARLIFPSNDDMENTKQFKARNIKRFSSRAA